MVVSISFPYSYLETCKVKLGLALTKVSLLAILFSLNAFPKHPSTQTKDKMVPLLLASNCPMRECKENKGRQNQG